MSVIDFVFVRVACDYVLLLFISLKCVFTCRVAWYGVVLLGRALSCCYLLCVCCMLLVIPC